MQFYAAYACNENYVEQTAVSMASLCDHCRGDQVTIYLMEDAVHTVSLQKIQALVEGFGQQLKIIPMRPLLRGMQLVSHDRHPDTIYAKLFLADICHADKILYLDSDTVVTAPLTALMSMDMGNACMAGVKMPYSNIKKRKAGLPPGVPYLCDGILLINLEKWRREHMTEKCTAYIKYKNGAPKMQSEGVVNYMSHGLVKVLPPEYNLMSAMMLWSGDQLARLYGVKDYYSEKELMAARNNPVIIHYLDELYIRPWYGNSDHPYRKIYQKYCRMAGFTKQERQKGKLQLRTRVLRILNDRLPFPVFLKVYQAERKMKSQAAYNHRAVTRKKAWRKGKCVCLNITLK